MRIGITILGLALLAVGPGVAREAVSASTGSASWYGEEHRGKLMANGKRFDPDKLTAASWFYPLGCKVRVARHSPGHKTRSVVVTITDRGPARDLVENGRIIDLTYAAFSRLRNPHSGLVPVVIERVR
jgi:rare lipoprotein A